MRFFIIATVALACVWMVSGIPVANNKQHDEGKANSKQSGDESNVVQGPRNEAERMAAQQAEQNPGLFEGDILLTPVQSKQINQQIASQDQQKEGRPAQKEAQDKDKEIDNEETKPKERTKVVQGPRNAAEKQAEQQAEQNPGLFQGDILMGPIPSKQKSKQKSSKCKNKDGTKNKKP